MCIRVCVKRLHARLVLSRPACCHVHTLRPGCQVLEGRPELAAKCVWKRMDDMTVRAVDGAPWIGRGGVQHACEVGWASGGLDRA